MSKNDLQTIDLAALATVNGGKATSASSGDDNSALMTALTGILGELSSLAASRNNSGFNAQEMMLFMMMMQQRNTSVVATPHAPAPTWTWDANGGYWIVK